MPPISGRGTASLKESSSVTGKAKPFRTSSGEAAGYTRPRFPNPNPDRTFTLTCHNESRNGRDWSSHRRCRPWPRKTDVSPRFPRI